MRKAMDAENMRFMATFGQIWDPKKDPENNSGMNGLEGLLGGMDASDMSAGGLPMIRPGDASKYC